MVEYKQDYHHTPTLVSKQQDKINSVSCKLVGVAKKPVMVHNKLNRSRRRNRSLPSEGGSGAYAGAGV